MVTSKLHRLLTTLVAILFIVGSCGFVLIEGWSFMDSLFMTIITLSTVGYGEVQELSPHGRMYTSVLITVSIVLMTCWTSALTGMLVSGEVSGRFQQKKQKKRVQSMRKHTIICGSGTMAQAVVSRLANSGEEIVVVTNACEEAELIRRLAPEAVVIEGDPKSELTLADANVLTAANLIAATDDDYDNLLVVITGKGLGTQVKVLSCAKTTELASRMRKVGADEVICPLVLGGERAAEIVTAGSLAAV